MIPAAEKASFVARRGKIMILPRRFPVLRMGEFFSCLAAFSVPRSMVDLLLSLVSIISMRSKSMIVIGSCRYNLQQGYADS